MTRHLPGVYALSWGHTAIDGINGAVPALLQPGMTWSWTGTPLRLDGPARVVRLTDAKGAQTLHDRAAKRVQQIVPGLDTRPNQRVDAASGIDPDPSLPADMTFMVTDGLRSFTVGVMGPLDTAKCFAVFSGDLPPAGRDLWVVDQTWHASPPSAPMPTAQATMCFTPGTQIATPQGPRLVQDLRPGDWVSTHDSGPQPILWIGQKHMTGARLFAMPHLRPIRLRAGLVPMLQADLLVSPDHHILVAGAPASALFSQPEVLVAARDLVDTPGIAPDHSVPRVRYIHLLLPQHDILWANGLATESFHPTHAALDEQDRADLSAILPDQEHAFAAYGPMARRSLSSSEAALLTHAA